MGYKFWSEQWFSPASLGRNLVVLAVVFLTHRQHRDDG